MIVLGILVAFLIIAGAMAFFAPLHDEEGRPVRAAKEASAGGLSSAPARKLDA